MSLEYEVKMIASNAKGLDHRGLANASGTEVNVHHEIAAIWDALSLIARAVDSGSKDHIPSSDT